MYEKIIVPLDGSELAERALDYVTSIAAASGAEVTLLHVCTPDQAESGSSRFWVYLLEHAAQILRARLEDVAGATSTVDSAVIFGHPAEEILAYADKNKVNLIAMTTHGRSGVRRWAMGSVAARVARHSVVPVLLVRSDAPEETISGRWPERRILVLLDGSERAEQVLPHVVDHAKIGGAEAVLLRVLEPLRSPAFYPPDMPGDWEELAERMMAHLEEECTRYFAGLKRQLRDDGIQVMWETLEGNVWDEIISYIERDGIDLVALTSHGRSSIARWAVGSVAETLVRKCPVPLLLVRAR